MKAKRPQRRPIGYPPAPEPTPPKRSFRRALAMGGILLVSASTFAIQWTSQSPAYAQGSENTQSSQWPEAESRGMREILDALKARERALDRREQSLISREADLRAVERDLESRIEELQASRTELEAMLEEADQARLARIKALVKMVESMRASEAAGVVTELPEDLAVEVLDEMKASKAGKLLAKMDAVKAATLAEKMANKAQPLNSGAE